MGSVIMYTSLNWVWLGSCTDFRSRIFSWDNSLRHFNSRRQRLACTVFIKMFSIFVTLNHYFMLESNTLILVLEGSVRICSIISYLESSLNWVPWIFRHSVLSSLGPSFFDFAKTPRLGYAWCLEMRLILVGDSQEYMGPSFARFICICFVLPYRSIYFWNVIWDSSLIQN